MNTKKIFLTILLAILLPLANVGQAHADDTDIYLNPPNVTRDDSPNVLIILDDSGSMETNSLPVTTPYDPTQTYDTTPGFATNTIYWTTGSVPTTVSAANALTASNNQCSISWSQLAVGTGATGQGYFNDPMAEWTTGGTGKDHWDIPAAGNDNLIGCEHDSPTYGGPGADNVANQVLDKNGGTGNYYCDSTSPSCKEFDWGSYSTSITLFSGNYLNYKNNPSATTTTETRMQVAKNAVDALINTNSNIRLGMMEFNGNNSSPNGGRVVARIQDLTSSWRTSLLNTVAQSSGWINPNGSTTSTSYSNMNWTPLAETMYEAYQYLRGGPVTYGGDNWDTGTNSSGLTDYPRPFPDICAEDDSNSAYCAGYDYSTVNVSQINTWYGDVTKGTYISPFTAQCQQAYVIIVTDGDPTSDTAADSAIKTLTGGTTYTTSGGTTGDTSDYLDDLAGYMYNNDIDSSLAGDQRVLTYTIGFGSDLDATGKTLLQYTADAGHGQFYDATSDANQLATSLQAAILDIQQTASSFAAPSLSVNAFNKLYNNDDIYFALFQPSSTVSWEGNIKKYHLCNTADETTYGCAYGDIIDANGQSVIDPANLRIKKTAQSYWSSSADGPTVNAGGAGAVVQSQVGSRNLYTFIPSIDYATDLASGEQTGFQITNSTSGTMYTDATANYSLLDSSGTISGLSTSTAKDTAVTDTIDWMLGYDYGSTSTSRWALSDPLHSRPVAITYGDVNGDQSKPITKLFFATNDGEIHMVNDADGHEDWSFLPQELLGNQYSLSQDSYGTHPYGADSSPTFWIQDNNGNGIIEPGGTQNDKVYMYIGMRRGGRNIYCFDVTPTTSDGNQGVLNSQTGSGSQFIPRLKWVIQGGVTPGFSRLGYTWSEPQVATIRVKCTSSSCSSGDSVEKTVLIFGGGYDPTQDSASFATSSPYSYPYGTDDSSSTMGDAIYIVDAATGAYIWSAGAGVVLPGSSTNSQISFTQGTSTLSEPTLLLSNMQYAIPSDISLMDSNGDGDIDRLYFGDLGGQVWRVDLDSQLTTGSSGSSYGYVFADLDCTWTGTVGAYKRDCGDTTVTTNQSWRKVFYPPDVAQMSDSTYSKTCSTSSCSTYDVVAIATGNRADPIGWQTYYADIDAVHNRIYALRDYNPTVTFTPTTWPKPIIAQDTSDPDATTKPDVGDMVNLTGDPIDAGGTTASTATTALQGSKGWFIDLWDSTPISINTNYSPYSETTNWVGEKALAKPVIYNKTIYVTTYTPANNTTSVITCDPNEGLGKVYALGLVNAAATTDLNGDGTLDISANLGGGIPSELVTVIRKDGVTGLIGTSGGAASPNIGGSLPRGKSYWYQQ